MCMMWKKQAAMIKNDFGKAFDNIFWVSLLEILTIYMAFPQDGYCGLL